MTTDTLPATAPRPAPAPHRMAELSDASLATLTDCRAVLAPAMRAAVEAEAAGRKAGVGFDWRPIPPYVIPGAVNGEAAARLDRLAAVALAIQLIHLDTPGAVVPPTAAVRALLAAGVVWRCRLTADRSRSIKGSYQYRMPGDRGWRALADTPQGEPTEPVQIH